MEDEIASKQLRSLYDELKKSQQSLHTLYEQSWEATLKFKSAFNDIMQTEKETEALRQRYYQMLEMHAPYKESDRDQYFELEQKLMDMKDRYILESQKLALGNSTYVAYSNKFTEDREEYIHSLLNDVDRYYVSNTSLLAQKASLEKTSEKLSKEISGCKENISRLSKEKEVLLVNENKLKQDCQDFTRRGNELSDQCTVLRNTEKELRSTVASLEEEVKQLEERIKELEELSSNLTEEVKMYSEQEVVLKKDISERKAEQRRMSSEISDLQHKNTELTKQRNNCIDRNKELTQKVAACRLATAKVEEQRDLFKEAFKQIKKEKNEIAQNCEKIKKEKEKFKERHAEMQGERQLVGKQKDRFVAKEYKTTQQNKDMSMAHKYLVKELEELKYSYRRCEERAKKDTKVKQDLRDVIKRIHREMEEERRRMQKETKDVKIQTDSDLACENRDIVILHAKLKLNQALKERDRAFAEKKQYHHCPA